jgi:hypothetical protein
MPIVKAGEPWRFTAEEYRTLETGGAVTRGDYLYKHVRLSAGGNWILRAGRGKQLWRACTPRGIRVRVRAAGWSYTYRSYP